jgi:hypothetical protein
MQRFRRTEKRLLEYVDASSINEFETDLLGLRIRLLKNGRSTTGRVPIATRNLPPPALQARTTTGDASLSYTDHEIHYFNPEHPTLGIAIPRYVDFLTGRQTHLQRTRLEVIPVVAPVRGLWWPSQVYVETNIACHPRKVPYAWQRKRYRNPYNSEFVIMGDLLGIIADEANKNILTEVRSPVTGYLIHFGVYAETSLVRDALVYLIAATGEPLPIVSKAVGTFHFPLVDGKPTPVPLGTFIPKGTILGFCNALGIDSEIPAPTDLRLVRSYIDHGKPIEHKTLLFHYLPETST